MPDVVARLIIQARDEASAAMRGIGTSTGVMGKTTAEAKFSFMELYAGVELAKQGIEMLKGAYESVIGPSIDLANETRKVQFNIGATAEEAGKLIYAAEATGVSFASLNTGLKAAIRTLQSAKSEGIAPTIEGLGKLADQYNAITDPIERTTFLLHNFGRSGADLAPLMALGSAGIKALGEEAKTTGAILDQEGVNSLHHLEMATREANASILGLKIAVAETFAPALGGLITHVSDNVNAFRLLNEGLKDGTLSIGQYVLGLGLAAGGLGNTGAIVDLLTSKLKDSVPAIDATYRALYQLDDMGNKLIPDVTAIKGAWDSYTVNTYHAAAATGDLTDATKKEHDAMILQQQSGLVSAGLSGTLQNAQRSYTDSVKGTQAEIDKLTKQIEAMTAANGKEFTVVTDSKVRQEDYNLAVERASLAQEKYAAALAGTTDKHGKFHQAGALALEGMRIAAESAQNSVDKLQEKMGSSTTVTADYTKALADAKEKLADLNQKQDDAFESVKKTTGAFILQQLALDTKLTPAMELNFARALGLIDEKSYNVAKRVQALTALWDLNKNGVIDAGVETDGLTRSLVGLDKEAIIASTTVPKATGATVLLGGAAHHATDDVGPLADAVKHLNDNTGHIPDNVPPANIALDKLKGHAWDAAQALNNIPNSVHVSVVTDWITNYTQNGVPPEARGGWHGAGGLDMIVPPGFPNDSFPVNVQSGEHVKVTPAGKGGDATLTALLTNLPGMIARAVRDGMQR